MTGEGSLLPKSGFRLHIPFFDIYFDRTYTSKKRSTSEFLLLATRRTNFIRQFLKVFTRGFNGKVEVVMDRITNRNKPILFYLKLKEKEPFLLLLLGFQRNLNEYHLFYFEIRFILPISFHLTIPTVSRVFRFHKGSNKRGCTLPTIRGLSSRLLCVVKRLITKSTK